MQLILALWKETNQLLNNSSWIEGVGFTKDDNAVEVKTLCGKRGHHYQNSSRVEVRQGVCTYVQPLGKGATYNDVSLMR